MAQPFVGMKIPEVFRPLFERPKRKNILYGGRGSAKSHTVARYVLTRAYEKPIRVLCTRELQKSIAESVHQLLSDCIEEMGLSDFFAVQRDRILGKNGSEFIFAGVRQNTNEIKSMENITICWVEEAQAMTQQSLDVLIPTIRAPGSILIFTFNPFKDSDPIYVMSQNPDDDTLVIKANHDDNPFFPEELRREMENCKKTDYDKYLWVWEGQCLGISKAQIFRDKYEVKAFDTPDNALFYYGGDWGFSNDPTTVIRSFIVGNTLYIDYEAYKVGCDIEDTPALYDTVPGTSIYPIYADNARPETISFMQSRRYNVIGAEKWSGCIEDGISYLRSFSKIIIHPRCVHTIEEFGLYQYKVDHQTNEVLREPLDKYNHCIDALRYSHTISMRTKSNGKVYDEFTIDNIITPIDYKGTFYLGTFVLPGQTLTLAFGVVKGTIVLLNDLEYKGGINFSKIVSDFPVGSKIYWFPLCKSEEVAPNIVQECIDAGIEPAVGSILPNEGEGAKLVNKLFANKSLYCCNNATFAITALNSRTYLADGKLEKNSQITKNVRLCELFEYAVWRTIGRIG
jgi:phage terminase large subunit